jgi:hypothetical protein
MELDITDFVKFADAEDYSASRAERGDNAATETWHAALDAVANPTWVDYSAPRTPMLDTEDKLQAMRDYIKGFGAWDAAEIAAMSDQHLNALLIQMIAGDMREGGLNEWEPDWKAYEEGAEAGTYSGRIYRGDDGHIYYYIGD